MRCQGIRFLVDGEGDGRSVQTICFFHFDISLHHNTINREPKVDAGVFLFAKRPRSVVTKTPTRIGGGRLL